MKYYNEDIENVLEKTESNINGLSEVEAKNRLKKYGKNILPKKKRPSILSLFFKEIISPIEIILIITVIISFIIGEKIDAFVIIFIILVDVIMGVYQENRALKQADALSNMLKTKTKVLRNSKEVIIDTDNLVVGDIILLESGSKISADARIINCNNLTIDESVLTGESVNVVKTSEKLDGDLVLAERKNCLYAGCSVITGRCKAVVVGTGINTEIGNIAKQVMDTKEEKTPLTIRMEKFTKQISIIIIFVALISAAILFINGYETKAIFLSVVALAVSAMPEGLPLALTMALTIGSNKMSKKNVIVKDLNSVEALGSCTVIASDKTGTLTVDEQTAKKIVLANGEEVYITGTGYNKDGQVLCNEKNRERVENIINLCSINNEATFKNENKYYGDSIDIAFLVLKEKMKTNTKLEVVKLIPYESEKQYSAVFYKINGELRCTIKGSLEKVMNFSKKSNKYIEQNEKLSKEGYRVIAVCDGLVNSVEEKDITKLEFLGMVAFIDPIRVEAKDSIEECKNAGIKVLMITGDHPLTAFKIANDLNLTNNKEDVITGIEVEKAYKKGINYFDKLVQSKKVFSRVTPTDKLHIVESLKRNGEFVAVTGDGVNDAPAIKCANIGIAMGSGTDVAKDTADMIIIDDNFKSIVAGVKEGRIAYANIRKIVLFLLSCGMAEVLFFLFSVIFGYDLPLIAIQLLWINVVTDGLQDMALSFETSSTDVMNEKPRKTTESIFTTDLKLEVAIFGLTIAIMIFSIWKYLIDNNVSLLIARSITMLLMVFIQNIHVLNCRSEKNSIFKTSIKTNKLVIYTIVGSILLQLLVSLVPSFAKFLSVTSLPINIIFATFVFSLNIILVAEIYKYIYRKKSK